MEPTLQSPARDRLQASELALGVGIRQSRTVAYAPLYRNGRAARAGRG